MSNTIVNADEILELLRADMGSLEQRGAGKLQIPPACFLDMQARFESYEPSRALVVSFPVLENQCNPAGFMQGGYIAAAFDNTYGPFSYLLAKKPTASIDMNVQYIRPVKTGQQVSVTARLVARGFSSLAMAGEMHDARGRLLATSQTNLIMFKV
ncbi:MAG: PaaI family thioesterase [Leptospiraceae bacterium]|nr:PaaI family thioesterase [Leptospiraceae bacterium]